MMIDEWLVGRSSVKQGSIETTESESRCYDSISSTVHHQRKATKAATVVGSRQQCQPARRTLIIMPWQRDTLHYTTLLPVCSMFWLTSCNFKFRKQSEPQDNLFLTWESIIIGTTATTSSIATSANKPS
jgi:hypothetical protein